MTLGLDVVTWSMLSDAHTDIYSPIFTTNLIVMLLMEIFKGLPKSTLQHLSSPHCFELISFLTVPALPHHLWGCPSLSLHFSRGSEVCYWTVAKHIILYNLTASFEQFLAVTALLEEILHRSLLEGCTVTTNTYLRGDSKSE